MSALAPIPPMAALAWLATGLAVGLAYFWLLHRAVRALLSPGTGGQAWPFHVLRFALAVAAFALLARQGALPLLLGFAGFLAARPLVRRWAEGTR